MCDDRRWPLCISERMRQSNMLMEGENILFYAFMKKQDSIKHTQLNEIEKYRKRVVTWGTALTLPN